MQDLTGIKWRDHLWTALLLIHVDLFACHPERRNAPNGVKAARYAGLHAGKKRLWVKQPNDTFLFTKFLLPSHCSSAYSSGSSHAALAEFSGGQPAICFNTCRKSKQLWSPNPMNFLWGKWGEYAVLHYTRIFIKLKATIQTSPWVCKTHSWFNLGTQS
jgi:hypothetical protein